MAYRNPGSRFWRLAGVVFLVGAVTVAVREFSMPASAAPAWGANCLACHGVVLPERLTVLNTDGLEDPDESATGAPDRGTLPVYLAHPGQSTTLTLQIQELAPADAYAVEMKQLRAPGVEQGQELSYSDDCDWAYWGSPGRYYTDPAQAHVWGSGPTQFDFDLEIEADAGIDIYDLVFTVAGQSRDQSLFYGEIHFYLRVTPLENHIFSDEFESGNIRQWNMAVGAK